MTSNDTTDCPCCADGRDFTKYDWSRLDDLLDLSELTCETHAKQIRRFLAEDV